MMTAGKLKLYNTLTRTKEVFEPIFENSVRMYVCGPTVYDFAHIGNARPVIVFDVLFRLLRHLYGEDKVVYARNVTDVDDKINERAFRHWTRKRPLTQEIRALTDTTLAQFREDVAALGCLPPTHEPRATDFIARGDNSIDMIKVIERLVKRGHAYLAEGHVLFDVPSMPAYGALARRPKDDMIAGARVEVAPYKRDPMDFVLWKPSNPETEPGWDSPWGYGRPGWHIECSAMSASLLGEVFDIHAGGLDLIFPHHENEIAQSCCAFGVPKMANYWLHNGFLQVEGEKMSKSLGNFITIDDLLHTDKFGGTAWSGDVLRFAMLKTHYRSPIDWTASALEEAERTLRKWYLGAMRAVAKNDGEPDTRVIAALSDDLNTPLAIAYLHQVSDPVALKSSLKLLGFSCDVEHLDDNRDQLAVLTDVTKAYNSSVVTALVNKRIEARKAKNFAESDRIRDELVAMGIQIMDGKDTVTGEPTTIWEVRR